MAEKVLAKGTYPVTRLTVHYDRAARTFVAWRQKPGFCMPYARESLWNDQDNLKSSVYAPRMRRRDGHCGPVAGPRIGLQSPELARHRQSGSSKVDQGSIQFVVPPPMFPKTPRVAENCSPQ
jgi:hypothetical protein